MRFISKLSHALMVLIFILMSTAGLAYGEINREQAIVIAKQHHPGKVLKVQRKETRSGQFYDVKILSPQGRIKVIRINAQGGNLIHPDQEPKRKYKKEKVFKKEKFKR